MRLLQDLPSDHGRHFSPLEVHSASKFMYSPSMSQNLFHTATPAPMARISDLLSNKYTSIFGHFARNAAAVIPAMPPPLRHICEHRVLGIVHWWAYQIATCKEGLVSGTTIMNQQQKKAGRFGARMKDYNMRLNHIYRHTYQRAVSNSGIVKSTLASIRNIHQHWLAVAYWWKLNYPASPRVNFIATSLSNSIYSSIIRK